jgi:hypothetical protein
LAKGQYYGSAPTTTKYAAFTGGFATLVGVLGLISLWIDKLPSLVIIGLDGVSALLLVAGGIVSSLLMLPIISALLTSIAHPSRLTAHQAFAVGLKGVTCEKVDNIREAIDMVDNHLLNEGTNGDFSWGFRDRFCSAKECDDNKASDLILSRCKTAVANEVLLFITFALAVGTVVISWLYWRKGKGGPRRYV